MIEIDELPPRETERAVGVLARGMHDNPMHVTVFGSDPKRRERRLHRLFGRMLLVMDISVLVARDEDENVVGVLGMAAPENCSWAASNGQRLRMAPVMLSMGLRTTHRTTQWMGNWGSQDPTDRHWHLGPVAVEPRAFKGKGSAADCSKPFVSRWTRPMRWLI